eukprot:6189562-Heterocapsa_arctica.AAC.1
MTHPPARRRRTSTAPTIKTADADKTVGQREQTATMRMDRMTSATKTGKHDSPFLDIDVLAG